MAIITISRGTFSGGKALAECVAKRLNYECISREILRNAARDFHVPLDELSKALSDKPGIRDNLNLAKMHYLSFIQNELMKAIRSENVVYHGLAGHLLLKGVPHVLRVKVVAGMEFRIKAAMERANLTYSDAIEFIEGIDKKRDEWVKFLYHVDRNDPALYDLVINLDHINMDTACDIVCLDACRPQLQPTEKSRKRIEDLTLAAEVRACIAADGNIKDDRIAIDAHEGVVTIGGSVLFVEYADRVREMTRIVPGVKDIDSKIRISAFSRY